MEKSEQHITETQGSASARKKRVLVVDDNPDLLSLHKTILEMDDYEVFTTLSGAEALAALDKITPDLILLDLRMEGMSGTDLLLALEEKRPDLIENVPIVFLTALDKVPASKAVGFIRKPYDFEKFLEAVHDFIESGAERPRHRH